MAISPHANLNGCLIETVSPKKETEPFGISHLFVLSNSTFVNAIARLRSTTPIMKQSSIYMKFSPLFIYQFHLLLQAKNEIQCNRLLTRLQSSP